MVSYQRWTAIVFDVAAQKGADTSEVQTEIISAAAEVWRANKETLHTATIAEAEATAQREISVS